MIDTRTFAEILLASGFKLFNHKQELPAKKINDNYFGASVYAPDIVFVKENKRVFVSIGGFLTARFFTEEEIKEYQINPNSKMIVFLIDTPPIKSEVFYKTATGIVPTNGQVEKFISAE